MYPDIRLRRLRQTIWLRDLVAETTLLPRHLIQPFFVIEGHNQRQEIKTLAGVSRLTIDLLLDEVALAAKLGIKAIALFPLVANEAKDAKASVAFAEDNLICRAIKAIKAAGIPIGIIADVALDPYTDHGHDGLITGEHVNNDLTLEALNRQALVLANAGADIIAPSDMMDGRVGALRSTLDKNNFEQVNILSYAIKFHSNLYGPFRDAVQSNVAASSISKATYQADFRNSKQALLEAELDVAEGADILMVKPASYYLDIIAEVAKMQERPVFCYQVSGEYAMLQYAAQAGAIDYHLSMIEALTAMRRAGASAILTYAAMDIASNISLG